MDDRTAVHTPLVGGEAEVSARVGIPGPAAPPPPAQNSTLRVVGRQLLAGCSLQRDGDAERPEGEASLLLEF